MVARVLSSSVALSAYNVTGQFPWSSLREKDRGVSAELTVILLLLDRKPRPGSLGQRAPSSPQFPLWRTSQSLKWEGVWRELACLAPAASFAVREESGHSLKSSLSVRSSRSSVHVSPVQPLTLFRFPSTPWSSTPGTPPSSPVEEAC